MTYEKPEIVVLGDASSLIKGNKPGSAEGPGVGTTPPDCEFDD